MTRKRRRALALIGMLVSTSGWLTLVTIATPALRAVEVPLSISSFFLLRMIVRKWMSLDRTKEGISGRWNLSLSLLLKPGDAEGIITHLEELHEKDIERYGAAAALFIYRKNVLFSLWPVARWAVHRAVALEVLKRFIGG